MTPEHAAAAWEGLATNPAAQQAAEGHDTVARWLFTHNQVAIGRERLHDLEQRADRNPDAGQLAFIVRDLMAAAGYEYKPDQPLHEQARQTDTLIRHHRQQRLDLEDHAAAVGKQHAAAVDHYAFELQRRDDLVTELRKQLAGADHHTAQVQDQIGGLRKIIMDKDAELEHVVTDTLRDTADKIRALVTHLGPEGHLNTDDLIRYVECPCRPGAPQHQHGQGGYRPEVRP